MSDVFLDYDGLNWEVREFDEAIQKQSYLIKGLDESAEILFGAYGFHGV